MKGREEQEQKQKQKGTAPKPDGTTASLRELAGWLELNLLENTRKEAKRGSSSSKRGRTREGL